MMVGHQGKKVLSYPENCNLNFIINSLLELSFEIESVVVTNSLTAVDNIFLGNHVEDFTNLVGENASTIGLKHSIYGELYIYFHRSQVMNDYLGDHDACLQLEKILVKYTK